MSKKRKKRRAARESYITPAQRLKESLVGFNWKLAGGLVLGCAASMLVYFLTSYTPASFLVMMAYVIGLSAVIIAYFIYNRGFVDSKATIDDLDDSMTFGEKLAYLNEIADRKRRSRWMAVCIVVLAAPLTIDLVRIFILEGVFGWYLF